MRGEGGKSCRPSHLDPLKFLQHLLPTLGEFPRKSLGTALAITRERDTH